MATPQFALDRAVFAVRLVRERLLRATQSLGTGGVTYAVTAECATAAWIGTLDPAAVRVAARVEILLSRVDLEAAARTLRPAGFVREDIAGAPAFLDEQSGNPRDAVRVVLADERSSPTDLMIAPAVGDFARPDPTFRALALEPHVRLGLSRFRRNDRVDLRDMLDVGLIDHTWLRRFPSELAARLQHLIDTPES